MTSIRVFTAGYTLFDYIQLICGFVVMKYHMVMKIFDMNMKEQQWKFYHS